MNCETADLLRDLDEKARDACSRSWRQAFSMAAERIRQLEACVDGGDTAIKALQHETEQLQSRIDLARQVLTGERTIEVSECPPATSDYELGRNSLRDLFAIVAPQCQPMESLSGLVSQINNYIAGLREENERLERTLRFIDQRTSWTNVEEAGFVVDVPAIQPMGLSFLPSVIKEMRENQPPF